MPSPLAEAESDANQEVGFAVGEDLDAGGGSGFQSAVALHDESSFLSGGHCGADHCVEPGLYDVVPGDGGLFAKRVGLVRLGEQSGYVG